MMSSVTPDELRALVADGEIDTVMDGFTDPYGRLLGKRFDADFFIEDCADAAETAEQLAVELRSLADWLGLERIRVGRRGDLTKALRPAVRSLA